MLDRYHSPHWLHRSSLFKNSFKENCREKKARGRWFERQDLISFFQMLMKNRLLQISTDSDCISQPLTFDVYNADFMYWTAAFKPTNFGFFGFLSITTSAFVTFLFIFFIIIIRDGAKVMVNQLQSKKMTQL